jgi:hypothetical protein
MIFFREREYDFRTLFKPRVSEQQIGRKKTYLLHGGGEEDWYEDIGTL